MLQSIFTAASRRVFGAVSKTISSPIHCAKRTYITPPSQREFKFKYDKEIVAKYPRVLDCIQEKIPREALTQTERAAYYVATFGNRVPGGRRIRAATKHTEFINRVNARVAEWVQQDRVKVREDRRSRIIRNAMKRDRRLEQVDKAPRLSSYKEMVNRSPKQVEFKLTKSMQEEAAAAGAV